MKFLILIFLLLFNVGFINSQQIIVKSNYYNIKVSINRIYDKNQIVYSTKLYNEINNRIDTNLTIELPLRDSISYICYNDSIISFLVSDRYQPELISFKKVQNKWEKFFFYNYLHPERPMRGLPNPSFKYSLLDVDIVKAIVTTFKDPNIKFEHIYRADFENPRKKGYFELLKEAKGVFKDIKYEYKYILISNKKLEEN